MVTVDKNNSELKMVKGVNNFDQRVFAWVNKKNPLLLIIHTLVNLIHNNAITPDLWRLSRVTPVHKGGPKNNVENYRPVMINHCLQQMLNSIHNQRIQHYNVGDANRMCEFILGDKSSDNHNNFYFKKSSHQNKWGTLKGGNVKKQLFQCWPS